MKWLLFYVEGCSPKIKKFKSLKKAEDWGKKFLKKNEDNTDDNWLNMIIKGSIEKEYVWDKDFDKNSITL